MKLFVSYSYSSRKSTGFGNTQITGAGSELSMDLVKEIEFEIKLKEGNDATVVVLNIIKLDA